MQSHVSVARSQVSKMLVGLCSTSICPTGQVRWQVGEVFTNCNGLTVLQRVLL